MSKEANNNEKSKGLIKNILIVIVFLVLGIGIGVYGTRKYLDAKESDQDIDNTSEWPLEITSKTEYSDQITNLYSIIQGNTMFYNSGGISYSLMNTNDKLTYIYNNLTASNVGETATLSSLYYGSLNCDYGFNTDAGVDNAISSTCTVVKIPKKEFTKVADELFDDKDIDVSNNFEPAAGKNCVSDNDNYICGNVTSYNPITGALESKFEIIRVTIDKDDTIIIYDKGYLVDKRSNVMNPNDGYDNYYLHSSDSTQYYYELKSADNLTFAHTFKKNEKGSYYYVNSILYKE